MYFLFRPHLHVTARLRLGMKTLLCAREEGRRRWQSGGKATGSCTYLLGSCSPGRQRRARRNHLLDPVNGRTEGMSQTDCQQCCLVSGAGSPAEPGLQPIPVSLRCLPGTQGAGGNSSLRPRMSCKDQAPTFDGAAHHNVLRQRAAASLPASGYTPWGLDNIYSVIIFTGLD